MAHSDTYIDSSLPFGLARVAAVTGNPMLDIGYQCRDSRPYFVFISGVRIVFTTLAPSKATSATTVDVYQMSSKVVDGVTYEEMELVGTGTQTGSVLDYGATFTNTDNAHLDIREFNINKWAKYKPQVYDKLGPLTDTERAAATYPYGIKTTTNIYSELHEQSYAYAGVPGDGDIARLTDFAGYNHEAAMNWYANVSIDGSEVTVYLGAPNTIPENSLSFHELAEALSGSEISSHYICLLASMAESDGETFNTHYACALKVGSSVQPVVQMGNYTAVLSEIPAYESGRKWKLTVFFTTTLLSTWTNVSSILTTVPLLSLPGAQALEFTVQ